MDNTEKQSPNTSPSDGEAMILRTVLHKAGISTGGMNVEQMRERHHQYREQQTHENQAREEQQRQRLYQNAADNLRKAEIKRKRAALHSAGIDAMKMTPEQVEAEYVAERERRERKQREQQAAAIFSRADCPTRHVLHLDTANQNQHPQWTATRGRLLERIGQGYLVALLGPRGTGKTQLAVSLIHGASHQLLSSRYVKALDLFRSIRATYNASADGMTETRLIDSLAALDLLVVDEVHQRGETAFEQNVLINLLDKRYDSMRSTLLISNQTKEDFAKAMGDSIVSRIHEAGDAITCDWPSFRKPGMWNEGSAE